ncbi:mannose-6-phosphate isomerase, class I [Metabacillus fastidiosus]|uniref:mannose-6-phosphate isomerase, class I n=1 Tax=Metabacillus fastidiosus TaxID=1458 RepID=UPI003D294ED5
MRKKVRKEVRSPIFLQPILQERIWGGEKLKRFNYEFTSDFIGECWGISAHPHGQSIVRNGKYKGFTLERLWNENRKLFGNYKKRKFPILVKILDANKDLSVQVHPNDEFASLYENGELGKTEFWYVIDCKEGAEIVYGHHAQTKEQFIKMIEQGKWGELLHRIPIRPGDFFYVPSGTIHALCEGTLILEIQQNSDTTYRLYDYDRVDSNGEKRELHLEKAISVSNVPHKDFQLNIQQREENGVKITTFVRGKYFSVYKWSIELKGSLLQDKVFQLASVIEGEGRMYTIEGEFPLRKGDHIILPATLGKFIITGNITLIVSHP